MKKRLLELGKDLLIALLLCSLLLLAAAAVPVETIRDNPGLSKLLQPLAPLLGLPEAELAYVETALPILDAAQPVAISVQNSMGRATAIWNFTSLDSAFETYGGLLGQAMDTAELFSEVSTAQLRKALSGSSVYFQYGCSLPVPLLASWLGANLEAGVPDAQAFLLALEDDAVVLYLCSETPLRAVTQVQPQDLEALLEQSRSDGSQLAFETGSHLDAVSILPGGSITAPGAAVSNPCDSRYIDQLATELGFNAYGETRYTDDEGVTYLSEANCALEISSSGSVLLTASAPDRFSASSDSDEALVETARQLVETAAGSICGDARLYLSGLTRQEDVTVCTFGYLVSGIPVALDGDAASVTFSGRSVVQLEVQVMTFTLSGSTLYPLPVAQAAAVLPSGSTLELQYRIGSDRTLSVGWKK